MAGTTGSSIDAHPRRAGRTDHVNEARAAAKRFVEAVASRDRDGMVGALAAGARLRYLVPGGPAEIRGAAEVAARFLGWFGDADVLQVRSVRVEPLADRMSVGYRFVLHEQAGWEVIEQRMYLDLDEDVRIAAIDLLCSGFLPDPDAIPEPGAVPNGTHRFDAGDLGCADGLATEFRRRIGAIPIGDVLVVTARDPAAKEDLPPLARMMGHTVRSVETPGDGRLLITVERKR
ncbi:MAG TPA: sulfurtransferase TusA family protein [Actinomycetota bacterium]